MVDLVAAMIAGATAGGILGGITAFGPVGGAVGAFLGAAVAFVNMSPDNPANKKAAGAAKLKSTLESPPPEVLALAKKIDDGKGGIDKSKLEAEIKSLVGKKAALIAALNLLRGFIALLNGPYGQAVAKAVVFKYAADTDTTVVLNAAVDDIINNAVAVALDPQRMGQVIARHTAKEQ